jgi:hypothetical protein
VPVKEITRTLRFFDFKIMQHERSGLWQEVNFEPIAEEIQKYKAKEGIVPSRYVRTDGERWIADFRSIKKGEIFGVFWQTIVDGLPVEELGGRFSPLGVKPGGGVAEPCVFGLFENKYLAYHINRRGPEAGYFGAYITQIFDRKFKVDIVPATLSTFEKMLPKIAAFTVLQIRPRFDRMGRIRTTKQDESIIGILKKLIARTQQQVELKITAGRHAHPDDAFEHEFAEFLKEHLANPENYKDFDILKGAALMQSGAIKPIDIMDRYTIEKKIKLRLDKNRGIDIADAIRKISTAYVGMRGQLYDRTTKQRG